MIRLLVIGVVGLFAFFPAYALFHAILGPDVGSIAAAVTGFLLIPILLLRVWKEYPDPSVIAIDPEDHVMREAIDLARSQLARFEQGLEEANKQAFVKYPVFTEDGSEEHVWGLAHSMDSRGVVVSLMNETIERVANEEELASRRTIPNEKLEDWLLSDSNGQCEGGYTHLALAKIYHRTYGKFPKRYRRQLDSFIDIDWSELDKMES